MALAPAPAARRGQTRRAVSIPAAALALLLALGAAASSSSLGGSSRRPSATAARTFRSVPHQPSPSAAARPPSSSDTAALHRSSPLLVRRQVAAPAWRQRHHLLAYPDDRGDEPRDPHGGAGDASGADAGRVARRASGEGAAETFGTSVVDPTPTPPNSMVVDALSSASLVRRTRRQVIAFVAAPARRRLLAYPGDGEPQDPHGAGDAAAAGADDAERAGITPPPARARCTFVTYIGGGGGTVEVAHEGDQRVFVLREHAGSSNVPHTDLAARLIVSSDEESDSDESDCECYRVELWPAMERFCRVLGHAVTAIDKAPWVLRLWDFNLR